jgi:hypothetical protein
MKNVFKNAWDVQLPVMLRHLAYRLKASSKSKRYLLTYVLFIYSATTPTKVAPHHIFSHSDSLGQGNLSYPSFF